jgi:hypothetical protein
MKGSEAGGKKQRRLNGNEEMKEDFPCGTSAVYGTEEGNSMEVARSSTVVDWRGRSFRVPEIPSARPKRIIDILLEHKKFKIGDYKNENRSNWGHALRNNFSRRMYLYGHIEAGAARYVEEIDDLDDRMTAAALALDRERGHRSVAQFHNELRKKDPTVKKRKRSARSETSLPPAVESAAANEVAEANGALALDRERGHRSVAQFHNEVRKKDPTVKKRKRNARSEASLPPAVESAAANEVAEANDEVGGHVEGLADGETIVCICCDSPLPLDTGKETKVSFELRQKHRDALLQQGAMLGSHIVRAYLYTVGRQFYSVGVRCVDDTFYPKLRSQMRLSPDSFWKRIKKTYKKANVDVAKLLLIPIFSGRTTGGHFSLVIIDRTLYDSGIFFYFGSHEALDSVVAEEVFDVLRRTKLWKKDSRWKLNIAGGSSGMPQQGSGTNDCGVFTCCMTSAFIQNALNRHAFDESKRGSLRRHSSVGQNARLSLRVPVKIWGQRARIHIWNSIRNGAVNFLDSSILNLRCELIDSMPGLPA